MFGEEENSKAELKKINKNVTEATHTHIRSKYPKNTFSTEFLVPKFNLSDAYTH